MVVQTQRHNKHNERRVRTSSAPTRSSLWSLELLLPLRGYDGTERACPTPDTPLSTLSRMLSCEKKNPLPQIKGLVFCFQALLATGKGRASLSWRPCSHVLTARARYVHASPLRAGAKPLQPGALLRRALWRSTFGAPTQIHPAESSQKFFLAARTALFIWMCSQQSSGNRCFPHGNHARGPRYRCQGCGAKLIDRFEVLGRGGRIPKALISKFEMWYTCVGFFCVFLL